MARYVVEFKTLDKVSIQAEVFDDQHRIEVRTDGLPEEFFSGKDRNIHCLIQRDCVVVVLLHNNVIVASLNYHRVTVVTGCPEVKEIRIVLGVVCKNHLVIQTTFLRLVAFF